MIRVLFLLILVLVILSWYVVHYPDNALDQSSTIWLQQLYTDELIIVSKWLAMLGGLPAVLVFIVPIMGYGYLKKDRFLIAYTFLVVMLTSSLTWLLKILFSRPRPVLDMQWVETYGSSFPSGHSAYAMAMACILFYFSKYFRYPKILIMFAVIWPVMMGLSRMYLSVHYLTDVLAGWLVALISVFVVKMTLNRSSTK